MATTKKRPRTARTVGGRTPEVSPVPAGKTRTRGSRVAAARHRAGLSQGQLASRLGVAKSTLARIELDHSSPSLDLALGLSRELGETVEALFGGGR